MQAAKPKLLIARAMFPDVLARLNDYFELEQNPEDRIFSPDELAVRLQGKFGMICTSSAKINQDLLSKLPELKIISTIAVGFDNFDLSACTQHQVMATNAPDVLNETTADFAWALNASPSWASTQDCKFSRPSPRLFGMC